MPNVLLEVFIFAQQRLRYDMVEVHTVGLDCRRLGGVSQPSHLDRLLEVFVIEVGGPVYTGYCAVSRSESGKVC